MLSSNLIFSEVLKSIVLISIFTSAIVLLYFCAGLIPGHWKALECHGGFGRGGG